jgi:hypothetical protein
MANAVGAIFMPKRKEDIKYLIEHRGEVLSGKAPDLPKNKLRRGERLRLF